MSFSLDAQPEIHVLNGLSTAHTNYLLCKSLSHLMKTKLTIQYTNSQILLEISSITNYIGDVPDGRLFVVFFFALIC